MAEPKPTEAELIAAIEALKEASPEEQEPACLALEEDHPPEIAARARLLLGIEERAAEIAAGLDAAQMKPEAMEELKQTVAGMKPKPDFKITILSDGEKKERIAELAEIFQSDKTEERLRYNTRKAEVAEELEVQQMDVHRAVMHYLEKEKKEKRDLTQSQKVVSLVLNDSNVHLWVDPSDRTPYVSIIVNKHCENYRLGDGAFETWVRAEYGRRHWTEVDGRRTPAVMSSVTLREGIATMRGLAATREEMVPALRVGGAPGEEVWLDLGTRDWELVKVTRSDWRIGDGGNSKRSVCKEAWNVAVTDPGERWEHSGIEAVPER